MINTKSTVTIDLGIISLNEDKRLSSKVITWSIAANAIGGSLHQRCLGKVFWSPALVTWLSVLTLAGFAGWFALSGTDAVLQQIYSVSSSTALAYCLVFWWYIWRALHWNNPSVLLPCKRSLSLFFFPLKLSWRLALIFGSATCFWSLLQPLPDRSRAFAAGSELTSVSYYCPFIGMSCEAVSSSQWTRLSLHSVPHLPCSLFVICKA